MATYEELDFQESSYKRVLAVGDPSCGKRSLLASHVYGKGLEEIHDFPTYIDEQGTYVVNDGSHKFLLYTTSLHQDSYEDRLTHYRHPSVILLCFSLNCPDSLENVENIWLPEIDVSLPSDPIILVGNKKDLRDNFEALSNQEERCQEFVTYEEGREVAEKIGAYAYVECSAFYNKGVVSVFEFAALASRIETHL